MEEIDKDSKILTKPICYLISIFLIFSIVSVTLFTFNYNLCYVPQEYKQYTNLNNDQTILFALTKRWALNPNEFYIFYYSKPFILINSIYMGSQDSNGFELYTKIYHNTQFNYLIWGYDILCLFLFNKLKKYMKSL